VRSSNVTNNAFSQQSEMA